MIKYLTILFAVFIATMEPLMAQQEVPGLKEAGTVLEMLGTEYKIHPVSFGVTYTYSNEHTPDELLDSVKGKIEMNGDNYRCLLDSTETIHNDKYSIVLFKEDKLMYLSGPGPASVNENPLSLMQSMLEKAGATACKISSVKSYKIIHIDFSAEAACKQIEMTIDTVSKRLLSMQYLIKTELLTGTDGETAKNAAKGYDAFALVRVSFYNYQYIQPGSNRFDDRSFFYKEATEFKTTPAYSDYKIFVGTPNL